jgi:acyl-CoA dehydrogenase
MALDHLDWPFFDDAHRMLAAGLGRWAAAELDAVEPSDVDAACRDLVRRLGAAGWLRYCVPAAHGGALPALDSRALCIAREILAYRDGLADFAFAMQGLGSGAITLAGTDAQKARWLPAVAKGEAIAAFALSEPDAGSDVAAMTARARRQQRLGARRRQDVDLQRRDRRFPLRVRAHRRTTARAGSPRWSCRRMHAGCGLPRAST